MQALFNDIDDLDVPSCTSSFSCDPLSVIDADDDGLSGQEPIELPETIWPDRDRHLLSTDEFGSGPRERRSSAASATSASSWHRLGDVLDELLET